MDLKLERSSHSFDPFIPMDRRQALVSGAPLPERTSGAFLFADLSGFTALTSWLADEIGPQRGAEELTQQLNDIYTALVAEVHHYRGSAIGFSGDGLACWFDGDDGRRAVTCALGFRALIVEKKQVSIGSGHGFPLGIKVAVTGGPVRRFLVGDPAIQRIDVLAGKPIDRAAQAEQVLSSGDIAIGSELLGALGGHIEGLEWIQSVEGEFFGLVGGLQKKAEPDPWPEIPQIDAETARAWVLPQVYDRLAEESGAFLAELRKVIPLFLRFRGIDFERDAEAGRTLDTFVQTAQAVLARYDGSLSQLTIGDKGSYLGAIFGAPIAHEDDVSRALHCALQLQEAVAKLDFIQSVQIGISSGWALAGAYGGAQRRTYGVQGPDVNLAARLMGMAKAQQVLVSSSIAHSQSGFQFEPLDPIPLKGLAEPVPLFALVGSQVSAHSRGQGRAIVGRERERGQIRDLLLGLKANPGEPCPSLVIEGEAGIGKTYLATDFILQAGDLGIVVRLTEGDEIERSTPYFAWRPILSSLLGIEEMDGEKEVRKKLAAKLEADEFLSPRAPLLADVLPVNLQDNELTRQIRGEARATSLRDVMIKILQRSLRPNGGPPQPALLIFDDAQWIDSATWALLNRIHRDIPELLLVVITRPIQAEAAIDKIHEAYARLVSQPDLHHVQLGDLSRDETAILVSRRLQANTLPDSILAFIHERAQGNPFFSEEIAYALRDGGFIRVDDGHLQVSTGVGDLRDIGFPDTIHGVITSRIDRLLPAHQLTLKVASVIGRIFLFNMLSKIYPVSIEELALRQNLELLAELDITPMEAAEPDLTYFFKHIITQEVVYQLMTYAQRKGLHKAAGLWYELNLRDDLSPHYSRLAYHWQHGGDPVKAIFYLEKAAEQALELYSNQEVIRFMTTAQALDEMREGSQEDPQARRIRLGHWDRISGLAHFRMGHLSEARAHYEKALATLGQPVPSSRGTVFSLIKEAGRQFFHRLNEKSRWRIVPASEEALSLELSRIDIGSVFYYSQDVALLAWDMLRRLNLSEKLGWEEGKAEGYSNLILFSGFLNLNSIAEMYRRLTNEAVEKAGSTRVRVYTYLREAVYLYPRCQWETAIGNLEEGVRLAREIADSRQWEECGATLATCLHHLGRYQEAVAIWQEHQKSVLQTESQQAMAWGLFGEGYNTLYLGKAREAKRLLEASLSTPMGDTVDKILEASRGSALALAYFRLGELESARRVIADHQAHHPASPAVSSSINEYGGYLDALVGLREAELAGAYQAEQSQYGSLAQAVKQGRKTVEVLKKRFAVNRAGAWLYAGLFDWLEGKSYQAVESWRRCIREAESNQQPYEAGRAYYELGHRLPVEDSSRIECLNQAVEIFIRLGAGYDLDKARDALGRPKLKTVSTG